MNVPAGTSKYVLRAAAIWNYLAAAAGLVIAVRPRFAVAMGLRGIDPLPWELFAACVLVFGIAYHWASTETDQHRDLIVLGMIGKPLVFLVCTWNFHLGNVPLLFALGSVVDLVFGVLFFGLLTLNKHPAPGIAVSELEGARYLSIPKIIFDLLLWLGAGYWMRVSPRWGIILALTFFVGMIPLHDLLVQGHEGSHGLISRRRWVNELCGWFAFAPVFISSAAHRVFHMRHHEGPHREGDPEYEFFNRLMPGVPGWAFLVIPAFAPLAVNWYAWHNCSRSLRVRIALELVGSFGLHAALAWFLGSALYGKVIVLPLLTGLPVASFLRAISEHHGTARGNEWKNSRSVRTNRVLAFLWSNVNYHLEHHLYPGVPYHRLPAVKQMLGPAYSEEHANIGEGYLRTATTLLRQPNHFSDK
jgi:fatty acid desaturase